MCPPPSRPRGCFTFNWCCGLSFFSDVRVYFDAITFVFFRVISTTYEYKAIFRYTAGNCFHTEINQRRPPMATANHGKFIMFNVWNAPLARNPWLVSKWTFRTLCRRWLRSRDDQIRSCCMPVVRHGNVITLNLGPRSSSLQSKVFGKKLPMTANLTWPRNGVIGASAYYYAFCH